MKLRQRWRSDRFEKVQLRRRRNKICNKETALIEDFDFFKVLLFLEKGVKQVGPFFVMVMVVMMMIKMMLMMLL